MGRTGSRQDINLARGCWSRGIVAHEIGKCYWQKRVWEFTVNEKVFHYWNLALLHFFSHYLTWPKWITEIARNMLCIIGTCHINRCLEESVSIEHRQDPGCYLRKILWLANIGSYLTHIVKQWSGKSGLRSHKYNETKRNKADDG